MKSEMYNTSRDGVSYDFCGTSKIFEKCHGGFESKP